MIAIVKVLLSATLIYLVNEVVIVRSKPLLGSLIASLPLVSLLTFVWIYYGLKSDPVAMNDKLASHSAGVFWFVLPSLPMFLIFPALLKRGLSFWPNLGICCLITMVLYALMAAALKKFGMAL